MSKAKRLEEARKVFDKAYLKAVMTCMEETAKAKDNYDQVVRKISGT